MGASISSIDTPWIYGMYTALAQGKMFTIDHFWIGENTEEG